jgi:tetratricopeptide (TPR) repeat protein
MNSLLRELLAQGKDLRLNGRYAEAADVLRRAVEMAERLYDQDAPETIAPLHALAVVLHLCEDAEPSQLPEALDLLQRALRTSETHFGVNSTKQITILGRLALTLWTMKRIEEAYEHLKRALDISEKAHGDDGHTASILRDLADFLLDMNRPAEALPFAERVFCIAERDTNDPAPVGVAVACIQLGRCLMGVGRKEEAIVHLERSIALFKARHPGKKIRCEEEIRGWIEALRKE